MPPSLNTHTYTLTYTYIETCLSNQNIKIEMNEMTNNEEIMCKPQKHTRAHQPH